MVDEVDPICYPKIIFTESRAPSFTVEPIAGTSDYIQTSSEGFIEVVFCGICEKNFIDKEEFDKHKPECLGARQKQYPCTDCDSTFRRQDHLKRHLRSVHSNSKCCICPVCEKDCRRHDVLMNHIKNRHSNEPQIFHCRECDYECGSLDVLEQHESTHLMTMTDRHICEHCKMSFKRRDHMLRHIKSQHLKEYTPCPICNQIYKRKDHVVRHIREKHRMGYLKGKFITSSDK